MSLNYSFSGKRILITGGSSGIGRQLVQRFHDGGATVFTLGSTPEKIQKLREELPNVRAEIVDLADWEATQEIVSSFGQIDYLVNNAATIVLERFGSITQESIRRQFDVNVGAVINVTQTMTKKLIELGLEGSVVNVGSILAKIGCPVEGVMYGASKAALENITKSMAIQLAPHNIRANYIITGYCNTPMLRKGTNGEELSEFIVETMTQRMIKKRIMQPGEVVDLIMFLLSPLSNMIEGESIAIDGGWLAG